MLSSAFLSGRGAMVDAAREEAMVSAGSNATIANNATSREQRTPSYFGFT